MDYEQLFIYLPKYPQIWTENEVQEWLTITGLKDYQLLFKSNQIDGMMLIYLNEKDLKSLGFEAVSKQYNKLIQWLQYGLFEYAEFLQDKYIQENEAQRKLFSLDNNKTKYRDDSSHNDLPFVPIENNTVKKQKSPLKSSIRFKDEKEIIENKNNNYTFSSLGSFINVQITLVIDVQTQAKRTFQQNEILIGRNPDSHIALNEDYVSRSHCKIYFDSNKQMYYIQDVGSTSGTFILLQFQTLLQEQFIIQVGSIQYSIEKIERIGKKCTVQMKMLDGPRLGYQFTIELQQDVSQFIIGRQHQIFAFDQNLSSSHAQFLYLEDGLVIEDLRSRNGTWVRLSKPQVKSEPIKLINGRKFRLGYERIFECLMD